MFGSRKFIIVACLTLILSLGVPAPAYAISFNFVGTILNAFKSAKEALDFVPRLYPFGGKISDTGAGCLIKYTVWAPCPIIPVLCPYPGFPIPLPGSTGFDINNTVETPGEIFTFPGISKVFANHNEGKKGVWAMGIGFTPFPIDKINDALDAITIPIGIGYLNNFHLDCSDSNNDVVLKVGTSGEDT